MTLLCPVDYQNPKIPPQKDSLVTYTLLKPKRFSPERLSCVLQTIKVQRFLPKKTLMCPTIKTQRFLPRMTVLSHTHYQNPKISPQNDSPVSYRLLKPKDFSPK